MIDATLRSMKKDILLASGAIVLIFVVAGTGMLHISNKNIFATGVKALPAEQKSTQQTSVFSGILQIVPIDTFTSKSTDTAKGETMAAYVLRDQKGTITEVVGDQKIIPNALNNTGVDITGVLQNGKIVPSKIIPNANVGISTISASEILTVKDKKIATILFNFQDNSTQPISTTQAKNIVYTSNPADVNSVHAYYREMSYGKMRLLGKNDPTGDVYGWYTIPYNGVNCSVASAGAWAASAASLATANGFDPAGYSALLFVFPQLPSCVWGGVTLNVTINGVTVPAALSNGGASINIIHELGHAFGLAHSNALTCVDVTGARISVGGTCTPREYGDVFDVMAATFRHMNAFQKMRLGVLSGANVKTVATSGTYQISMLESRASTPQVIVVPIRSTLGQYSYYLEYRRPFGVWDAFGSADPVVNGISIRVGQTNPATSTTTPLLLDMTPGTIATGDPSDDFRDGALALSQTFRDDFNEIRITPTVLGSTSASVAVTVNTACVHATPTVTIAPSATSYVIGQTFPVTATVRNNDSAACAPAQFSITSGQNVISSPVVATATIAPGASTTQAFALSYRYLISSGVTFNYEINAQNIQNGYGNSSTPGRGYASATAQ